MPDAVLTNTNPFDAIREYPDHVHQVDEETYWYALEVLPPIYAKGCWAMSEAWSHDHQTGEATYYWFAANGPVLKKGTKFYATLATRAQAEDRLNICLDCGTPKGQHFTTNKDGSVSDVMQFLRKCHGFLEIRKPERLTSKRA